ncbi:MAG: hypothetical protein R3F50_09170 [Gammaproteobacteria bacterium]
MSARLVVFRISSCCCNIRTSAPTQHAHYRNIGDVRTGVSGYIGFKLQIASGGRHGREAGNLLILLLACSNPASKFYVIDVNLTLRNGSRNRAPG